jgi:hypothetical protein
MATMPDAPKPTTRFLVVPDGLAPTDIGVTSCATLDAAQRELAYSRHIRALFPCIGPEPTVWRAVTAYTAADVEPQPGVTAEPQTTRSR